MPRRIIPFSLGAAGLMIVAVALWLPKDFGSRSQADPASEPATSDIKLVARGCALFITFRPADFTADELVKAIIQDMPRAIEKELHVTSYGIERMTIAVGPQGPVHIVQTKKAYDADKIREALSASQSRRFKYSDKDKDGGPPEKASLNEKKVGGRKIYYADDLQRWTTGWCPIDKNTFMQGGVASLEALLSSKSKASPEMTDALGLASRHSLVLAVDGKRLRSMVSQTRKDRDRERREGNKMRRDDKDKSPRNFREKDKASFRRGDRPARDVVPVSAQNATTGREEVPAEDKPRDEADDLDLLFESPGMGVVMLPYKPLLASKFGLLTLDIKKSYTLTATIDFDKKDELDDGETALKSLLYVGRELAGLLPKVESDFMGMQPLTIPVRKAFKEARIDRKGNTLSTTVSLMPEAGLARKVRDGMAEAKKKQEEKFKMRPRDKDKSRVDKYK